MIQNQIAIIGYSLGILMIICVYQMVKIWDLKTKIDIGLKKLK